MRSILNVHTCRLDAGRAAKRVHGNTERYAALDLRGGHEDTVSSAGWRYESQRSACAWARGRVGATNKRHEAAS